MPKIIEGAKHNMWYRVSESSVTKAESQSPAVRGGLHFPPQYFPTFNFLYLSNCHVFAEYVSVGVV